MGKSRDEEHQNGMPTGGQPEPSVPETLAPAALRASAGIARQWGVTTDDTAVLLGMTVPAYAEAIAAADDVELTLDQFHRASLLIGIYGALADLLSDMVVAEAWPTRPNTAPTFGGRTPVEVMKVGGVASMDEVLRYLRGVAWAQ